MKPFRIEMTHKNFLGTLIFDLECDSIASKSNQRLNRKSVQFFVKEERFEEFQTQPKVWTQLQRALSHGLGIPEKNITSYPASSALPYKEDKYTHIVYVGDKALITILVSGVEKAEIKTHCNMIINLLSSTTKFKESDIEILQIVPKRSCLLVIRLPGLAMLHLVIAFFNPRKKQTFLQKFAEVLPSSASDISFGFFSLSECSAALPILRPTQNFRGGMRHFGRHVETGMIKHLIKD